MSPDFRDWRVLYNAKGMFPVVLEFFFCKSDRIETFLSRDLELLQLLGNICHHIGRIFCHVPNCRTVSSFLIKTQVNFQSFRMVHTNLPRGSAW
jgi:hypothetical protein